MENDNLEKLRYPVGRFSFPENVTLIDREKCISVIENFPLFCRNEFRNFTEEMLEESYRPGGWTARQVIHHVVDSHMNAYIRFKLALTEDLPTIKPYKENLWAELDDSKNATPEISLSLLEALHRRWLLVLKNMTETDFERRYFHPESKKEFTLNQALALYAWHCRHHLEHIRLVKRKFIPA